jgi:hypothetical protein
MLFAGAQTVFGAALLVLFSLAPSAAESVQDEITTCKRDTYQWQGAARLIFDAATRRTLCGVRARRRCSKLGSSSGAISY